MPEGNNHKEDLPSIEEIIGQPAELPSIEEIIENPAELPSINEFIEEEKVEEQTQTIEDANGNTFAEVKDIVPPWPELLRMINDIRESIPEIPEIKIYDEELENLTKSIEQVRGSIPEVQEVRYYEKELQELENSISEVKESIPTLPKWIEGVNEVPDFNWIGKTFNVIDDRFRIVKDSLETVQEQISVELSRIQEEKDVLDFAQRTDNDTINKRILGLKDEIYDQLKEQSTIVWKLQKKLKEAQKQLEIDVISKIDELEDKTIEHTEGAIAEKTSLIIDDYNSKISASSEKLDEEVKILGSKIDSIASKPDYGKQIISLKAEVRSLNALVETIKIDSEKEILKEATGLTPDPAQKEGEDPLTPTNQKFATLKDLAANYRLFVNRVEQQIATLGGGGEVQLQYLDDIVGIATNLDAYDGMYLGINTAGILTTGQPFQFMEVAAAGAGGTWASTSTGIHTTKNVGIATTLAKSDWPLYVSTATTFDNAAYFGGVVHIGGTTFQENVKNIESTGIVTALGGIRAGVTTFTEELVVQGDARVTGILTIGTASITIDGENETITVGNEDVTITNSAVTIGTGVTISANASGINSAPNVVYVAKDGSDNNNGTSIDNAKLTIAGAVGIATTGYVIKVLSGTYVETNPVEVPAFVSIVGDDQRTVNVSGSTANKDIFHVRKGSKLSNMTFQNHLAPAAAVGFPTTEIAENIGGGKWKGPYIQNCTSDTTTGTGIRIDGAQARSLKAMNVDAFTQYNQGGVGVAVTNKGFAQLVSVFTICTNEAITCDDGGQADIANSNCSFGSYGLVARGVGPLRQTGIVTTAASATATEVEVVVDAPQKTITGVVYNPDVGVATITTSAAHGFGVGMGVTINSITMSCTYGQGTYPSGKKGYQFEVLSVPSTTSFSVNVGVSSLAHTYVSGGTAKLDVLRPYDGQGMYFDTLYYSVDSLTISNAGTGYTVAPPVILPAPTGPTGTAATAFATIDSNGTVDSLTMITNGNQYGASISVTIGDPANPATGTTALATANMEPLYYTINSATGVTAGITTITLDDKLVNAVGVGTTAYFHQLSRVVASSHTFEYIGSGNEIANATPKRGGVTIQANEVVTSSGGKVLYTSTDQAGNFRVGDDLQINQSTGTISGRAFSKSLFSEMTPFILALS